jgi:DNA-binding NtrC family response regulator
MRVSTRRAGGAATPPERAYLLVYHRNGLEPAVLEPGVRVVIGRETPADVVIPEVELSAQHASFVLANGVITVEDLGSTNGTEVDGERVSHAEVGPGQEIDLGPVRVSVHTGASTFGAPLRHTSHEDLRVALRRALLPGQTLALLRVRAARSGVHVSLFGPRVRAALQADDRTATYSKDTLEVLCPDLPAEDAMALARRVSACAKEAGPLLVGVALYPSMGATVEELIEKSGAMLAQATAAAPVPQAPRPATAAAKPRGRPPAPVVASPAMRAIYDRIARVGGSRLPVLIHGETGTGKEKVAEAIHAGSPRRDRPMIPVNCGAISRELVESHLFGHMRGAFTGALKDQKGAFEAADGGTIFLDEIGELPPAAQVALLRVLDNGRITPVGATSEIEVDVRVVAATHRDLDGMCRSGAFRTDLYFRLKGERITLPPLRDRPEDIEALIERFLRDANEASGKAIRGVEPRALAWLKSYPWPGNVRELRNTMERAVTLAEGDLVTEADLPEERLHITPPSLPTLPTSGVHGPPALLPEGLRETLRRVEIQLVEDALEATGDSLGAAAKLLKLPERTLSFRITKLGVRRRGG